MFPDVLGMVGSPVGCTEPIAPLHIVTGNNVDPKLSAREFHYGLGVGMFSKPLDHPMRPECLLGYRKTNFAKLLLRQFGRNSHENIDICMSPNPRVLSQGAIQANLSGKRRSLALFFDDLPYLFSFLLHGTFELERRNYVFLDNVADFSNLIQRTDTCTIALGGSYYFV